MLNQAALSGIDVDDIKIVELRNAVVERDDDFIGEIGADLLNTRMYFLKRSQVFGLSGVQIYAVEMPVLVPIFVLNVQNMVVGISPAVGTNTAFGVVCDRLRCREVGGGTDPNVEYAV